MGAQTADSVVGKACTKHRAAGFKQINIPSFPCTGIQDALS